jgi:hypothetical protein
VSFLFFCSNFPIFCYSCLRASWHLFFFFFFLSIHRIPSLWTAGQSGPGMACITFPADGTAPRGTTLAEHTWTPEDAQQVPAPKKQKTKKQNNKKKQKKPQKTKKKSKKQKPKPKPKTKTKRNIKITNKILHQLRENRRNTKR